MQLRNKATILGLKLVTVPSFQENRLRQVARDAGDCADLIYYLAVRREGAALERLRRAGGLRQEDALLLDLFLGEDPASCCGRLVDPPDPFLCYSLAKGLLRAGDFDRALRVMQQGLESGVPDVTTINLLARYALHRGEAAIARELLKVSLQISETQEDLRQLAESDGTPDGDLYLDPLPKPVPLTFYYPCYNAAPYLERAIEGMLAQCYPLTELIIVDDGSTDGTREIAAHYPVTILTHPENRGLAAARNTAMHHASTPFVGSLDADAFPSPAFARYLMMEFENADSRVAGVGGKLEELYSDTPADFWRTLHLSQDQGVKRFYCPRFLFGSNTIYRRGPVLEIGGFDERFRTNSEDGDIALRLQAAGYGYTYTPLALAYHMRRDTPRSVLRMQWGWAFAQHEARGVVNSIQNVLEEMRNTLGEAIEIINDDFQKDLKDTVYINYLYVFHDSFWNLDYCLGKSMLAPGQARFIQEQVLGAIACLTARYGDALYRKVMNDTGALLVKADPTPLDDPGHVDALARFLADFQRFHEAITPEVYALLNS